MSAPSYKELTDLVRPFARWRDQHVGVPDAMQMGAGSLVTWGFMRHIRDLAARLIASESDRMTSAAPEWAHTYRARNYQPFAYTADPVAVAVDMGEANDGATLKVLLALRGRAPFRGLMAIPGGFVDAAVDYDAEAAAARELQEETGVDVEGVYREAIDTYDAFGRDPRQFAGFEENGEFVETGARVVSKAYLFAMKEMARPTPQDVEEVVAAEWVDIYAIFPWEDQRTSAGRRLAAALAETLIGRGPVRAHHERIAVAFGLGDHRWNEERVRERWDLICHAGFGEAARDEWGEMPQIAVAFGRMLAFDHRTILADALGRVRGKVKWAPALLSALMPAEFSMARMRRTLEAISGLNLNQTNLDRQLSQSKKARILEWDGLYLPSESPQGGRPSKLMRFVDDVDQIRLDPAIALPLEPEALQAST